MTVYRPRRPLCKLLVSFLCFLKSVQLVMQRAWFRKQDEPGPLSQTHGVFLCVDNVTQNRAGV